MVTIEYALSAAGQKASLVAGGNGKRVQQVTVMHGDPDYPSAVMLAEIGHDGNGSLDLHANRPQGEDGSYRVREYDAPPTVSQLLADEQQRRAWVAKRQEEADRKALAELTADVPNNLLTESSMYGWRVKDEAIRRAKEIGADAIALAELEAARRNTENAERRAAAKAEQEAAEVRRKAEKAKADARRAAEIAAWAKGHGSPRLKRCVAEGIDCEAIYLDERMAMEFSGWRRDGRDLPNWEDPRNPPESALALLDQARASLPAGWSDEDRESAELRYWTKKDEYGERHSGYVVVVDPGDWCDSEIVYGYDGPESDE